MLHLKFMSYLAYFSHFVHFALILKSLFTARPVEPRRSNLTCLCGRRPSAFVSRALAAHLLCRRHGNERGCIGAVRADPCTCRAPSVPTVPASSADRYLHSPAAL